MLLLLSTGRAWAQLAPKPERQLSFTVFSAEPIASLGYKSDANAAVAPLVFYPTARSPRYEYRGSEKICLFDIISGEVVAEASVPMEVQTALLILSRSTLVGPGRMRYGVQVIDDSALRHAPGRLVVQNLSGLLLDGAINGRRLTLADGAISSVHVGRAAAVNLRTLFRGRSYQAYAEAIQLEASGRALLLLLPPYHKGSLEVQSRLLLDVPAANLPALR